MTSGDNVPPGNRLPRASDGPARKLREHLAGLKAGNGAASRRERLQFRCLKRLSLPRLAQPSRLAPNL